MARIIPDDIEDVLKHDTGHRAEWATLGRLRDELSDEYTVYHAVHWANVKASRSVYGEIDFIVANRYGKLLAIEQKDTQVFTRLARKARFFRTGM